MRHGQTVDVPDAAGTEVNDERSWLASTDTAQYTLEHCGTGFKAMGRNTSSFARCMCHELHKAVTWCFVEIACRPEGRLHHRQPAILVIQQYLLVILLQGGALSCD